MPFLPTLSLLASLLVIGFLFRLYAWRTTLSTKSLGLMFGLGCVGATAASLYLQNIPMPFLAREGETWRNVVGWTTGPLYEELLKAAAPIMLMLSVRLTRRLSVVDFALAGFACGLGFAFVEINMRRLITASVTEGWSHIWALGYDVSKDNAGNAMYWPGHYVYSAMVGLALGVGAKLWPERPIRWLPGLLVLAYVTFQHQMWNWKASHSPTAALADAPQPFELIHDLTGNGLLDVFILPVAVIAATIWESRRLARAEHPAQASLVLPGESGKVWDELREAATRAPLGRETFARLLAFFRSRRALAVAEADASGDPLSAPYAELTREELVKAYPTVVTAERSTWAPDLRQFAPMAQMAFRHRGILITLAAATFLLFFLAPNVWKWVHGEVLGEIIALVSAGFVVWRVLVWRARKRPDPATARGEALAVERLQFALLCTSIVMTTLSLLAVFLHVKGLTPDTATAYVSSHFYRWWDRGGNAEALLALGSAWAAFLATPDRLEPDAPIDPLLLIKGGFDPTAAIGGGLMDEEKLTDLLGDIPVEVIEVEAEPAVAGEGDDVIGPDGEILEELTPEELAARGETIEGGAGADVISAGDESQWDEEEALAAEAAAAEGELAEGEAGAGEGEPDAEAAAAAAAATQSEEDKKKAEELSEEEYKRREAVETKPVNPNSPAALLERARAGDADAQKEWEALVGDQAARKAIEDGSIEALKKINPAWGLLLEEVGGFETVKNMVVNTDWGKEWKDTALAIGKHTGIAYDKAQAKTDELVVGAYDLSQMDADEAKGMAKELGRQAVESKVVQAILPGYSMEEAEGHLDQVKQAASDGLDRAADALVAAYDDPIGALGSLFGAAEDAVGAGADKLVETARGVADLAGMDADEVKGMFGQLGKDAVESKVVQIVAPGLTPEEVVARAKQAADDAAALHNRATDALADAINDPKKAYDDAKKFAEETYDEAGKKLRRGLDEAWNANPENVRDAGGKFVADVGVMILEEGAEGGLGLVADGVKAVDKLIDGTQALDKAIDGLKAAERGSDALHGADAARDTGRAMDNARDAARPAEGASDAAKAAPDGPTAEMGPTRKPDAAAAAPETPAAGTPEAAPPPPPRDAAPPAKPPETTAQPARAPEELAPAGRRKPDDKPDADADVEAEGSPARTNAEPGATPAADAPPPARRPIDEEMEAARRRRDDGDAPDDVAEPLELEGGGRAPRSEPAPTPDKPAEAPKPAAAEAPKPDGRRGLKDDGTLDEQAPPRTVTVDGKTRPDANFASPGEVPINRTGKPVDGTMDPDYTRDPDSIPHDDSDDLVLDHKTGKERPEIETTGAGPEYRGYNSLDKDYVDVAGAQREAANMRGAGEQYPGGKDYAVEQAHKRYEGGVERAGENLQNPEFRDKTNPEALAELEEAVKPENRRSLEDFRESAGMDRTPPEGPTIAPPPGEPPPPPRRVSIPKPEGFKPPGAIDTPAAPPSGFGMNPAGGDGFGMNPGGADGFGMSPGGKPDLGPPPAPSVRPADGFDPDKTGIHDMGLKPDGPAPAGSGDFGRHPGGAPDDLLKTRDAPANFSPEAFDKTGAPGPSASRPAAPAAGRPGPTIDPNPSFGPDAPLKPDAPTPAAARDSRIDPNPSFGPDTPLKPDAPGSARGRGADDIDPDGTFAPDTPLKPDGPIRDDSPLIDARRAEASPPRPRTPIDPNPSFGPDTPPPGVVRTEDHPDFGGTDRRPAARGPATPNPSSGPDTPAPSRAAAEIEPDKTWAPETPEPSGPANFDRYPDGGPDAPPMPEAPLRNDAIDRAGRGAPTPSAERPPISNAGAPMKPPAVDGLPDGFGSHPREVPEEFVDTRRTAPGAGAEPPGAASPMGDRNGPDAFAKTGPVPGPAPGPPGPTIDPNPSFGPDTPLKPDAPGSARGRVADDIDPDGTFAPDTPLKPDGPIRDDSPLIDARRAEASAPRPASRIDPNPSFGPDTPLKTDAPGSTPSRAAAEIEPDKTWAPETPEPSGPANFDRYPDGGPDAPPMPEPPLRNDAVPRAGRGSPTPSAERPPISNAGAPMKPPAVDGLPDGFGSHPRELPEEFVETRRTAPGAGAEPPGPAASMGDRNRPDAFSKTGPVPGPAPGPRGSTIDPNPSFGPDAPLKADAPGAEPDLGKTGNITDAADEVAEAEAAAAAERMRGRRPTAPAEGPMPPEPLRNDAIDRAGRGAPKPSAERPPISNAGAPMKPPAVDGLPDGFGDHPRELPEEFVETRRTAPGGGDALPEAPGSASPIGDRNGPDAFAKTGPVPGPASGPRGSTIDPNPSFGPDAPLKADAPGVEPDLGKTGNITDAADEVAEAEAAAAAERMRGRRPTAPAEGPMPPEPLHNDAIDRAGRGTPTPSAERPPISNAGAPMKPPAVEGLPDGFGNHPRELPEEFVDTRRTAPGGGAEPPGPAASMGDRNGPDAFAKTGPVPGPAADRPGSTIDPNPSFGPDTPPKPETPTPGPAASRPAGKIDPNPSFGPDTPLKTDAPDLDETIGPDMRLKPDAPAPAAPRPGSKIDPNPSFGPDTPLKTDAPGRTPSRAADDLDPDETFAPDGPLKPDGPIRDDSAEIAARRAQPMPEPPLRNDAIDRAGRGTPPPTTERPPISNAGAPMKPPAVDGLPDGFGNHPRELPEEFVETRKFGPGEALPETPGSRAGPIPDRNGPDAFSETGPVPGPSAARHGSTIDPNPSFGPDTPPKPDAPDLDVDETIGPDMRLKPDGPTPAAPRPGSKVDPTPSPRTDTPPMPAPPLRNDAIDRAGRGTPSPTTDRPPISNAGAPMKPPAVEGLPDGFGSHPRELPEEFIETRRSPPGGEALPEAPGSRAGPMANRDGPDAFSETGPVPAPPSARPGSTIDPNPSFGPDTPLKPDTPGPAPSRAADELDPNETFAPDTPLKPDAPIRDDSAEIAARRAATPATPRPDSQIDPNPSFGPDTPLKPDAPGPARTPGGDSPADPGPGTARYPAPDIPSDAPAAAQITPVGTHSKEVFRRALDTSHVPTAPPERLNHYRDLVRRARATLEKGDIGSCEGASEFLAKNLGGDVQHHSSMLVGKIQHEYVLTHEGYILDPVARQAVTEGGVKLSRMPADLRLAMEDGIFTPDQWERFNALGKAAKPRLGGFQFPGIGPVRGPGGR